MSTGWRRFLHRWAGTLPTVIYDAEQSEQDRSRSPLFERGRVFTVRMPFLGEVTCYLHHYLRSDPDRGMHDHPWPWAVAFPLAAGYYEERLSGIYMGNAACKTRRRLPFVPYRLSGFDFHRVVIDLDRTSWSLFFTGRNNFKRWGFLRPLTGHFEQPGVYYAAQHSRSSTTEWWESAPIGAVLDRADP